ncbi:hypothetical protein [Prolixibacter denitrificans]|uniref:ABC-2 type transport system permease protein n=1 Tax=Prolixibacter denitrificans TaxID=1541063 RepID=A0A2P8CHN4_9BACT|nr:hypothetical protein [Prolixibacter denitrificans]PSK84487.1 hypothetical protein CLV93_102275 [Prolixibacter denitrificans]GET20658.1 hypothetical protein JCM18694_09040 [Prolixibacter denitrificans]
MVKFIVSLFWPFRRLIEWTGVDYGQFITILKLKLLMDNRRNTAFSSKRGGEARNMLLMQSGLYALFGAILTGMLQVIQSAFVFYFVIHSMVMIFTAMLIISEFYAILFATSDNSLIHSLPVNGQTVNLARNAHIFVYLFLLGFSLSLVPMIMGAFRFGIITLVVYIGSLALNAAFTLFLTNIMYLGIMKLASGEKLKNLMMYFQVAIAIFFMAFYQYGIRLIDNTDVFNMFVTVHWYTFLLPQSWFAGTIDAIATSNWDLNHLIFVALTIGMPLAAAIITGKYLTPLFNKKLADLEQGDRSSPVRKTSKVSGRWSRTAAKIFTRKAEERASFTVMWKMIGRERQFKLMLLPSIGYILVLLPLMFQGKHMSSLGTSQMYLVLLYFPVLISATLANAVLVGEQKMSGWIFRSSPMNSPAELFRGIIKAGFIRFLLPVYFIVSAVVLFFWGPSKIDDIAIALLANYLMTIIIYYYQTPRFPFSMEKSAVQGGSNGIRVMLSMLIVVFIALLHWGLLSMPFHVSLLLIPLYLTLIWYVDYRWVYTRITWKEIDKNTRY